MDVFNMDLEEALILPQQDIYASSLDSTAESLPDLDEAQTPLLYVSKITSSSRHNSLVPTIEEHMIETLDLSEPMAWSSSSITPQPPITLKCNTYYTKKDNKSFSNISQSDFLQSDTTVIEETIEKGTTALKNNYKLWLTSQ